MKVFQVLMFIFFLASCGAANKDRSYTGSTPANAIIRSFLGIPANDSIDFIRWQLDLRGNQYHLHANFGIGRPNTNGFINDGIKNELNGVIKKDKNAFILYNGDKTLKLVELNEGLLHFLNPDNSLLIGNGGWSYTLNSLGRIASDKLSLKAKAGMLKDSMAFEGRTPCQVPNVIPPGKECYKLKWYIVLYADVLKNQPTVFKIRGTRWRKEGDVTGTWKIAKGKNDRIVYQLALADDELKLYLLKTDENILVFTDADGKLLVGNEDFSYTLNRFF